MASEELVDEAKVNLAILERADAYMYMLESAGWRFFWEIQSQWLDLRRKEAVKMGVANNAAAIYAWQAAEDLLDTQARHINSIIEEANQLRGNTPLEVRLMMERVKHEHGSESGNPEDPTGY